MAEWDGSMMGLPILFNLSRGSAGGEQTLKVPQTETTQAMCRPME
jgi:hypothetical protein